MPWKRKKKMGRLPEGVTVTELPEAEALVAAGITDAHIDVSAQGVKLVYWQEGAYHEAMVPAILVPSFTRIIGKDGMFR